jgi:hypothetical protein
MAEDAESSSNPCFPLIIDRKKVAHRPRQVVPDAQYTEAMRVKEGEVRIVRAKFLP